jgi:hypothetical protein
MMHEAYLGDLANLANKIMIHPIPKSNQIKSLLAVTL